MPSFTISYMMQFANLGAEERRQLYKNWILAKGFQDLLRGIRDSLESAYLFASILSAREFRGTLGELEARHARFQKEASAFKFPQLMGEVEAIIGSALDHRDDFINLQGIRNCLEHRSGIVGTKDLAPGRETMTLSYPYLKVFYLRDGEELPVLPGAVVDAGDGASMVEILMKMDRRTRDLAPGARIEFSPEEFVEIAMACDLFGAKLASALPKTA